MIDWLPLLAPFALVAMLYGSVGHGGASGYLAVMALAGVVPVAMKPTALVLNLAVSLLGTLAFFRAGYFTWRLFWPFAVVSIPFAFLGGRMELPAHIFRLLIAAALAFAAVRLLWPAKAQTATRPPPAWAVVGAGAAIGFASGLIGVGGGIFLTPLLLFCRWADVKTAAAVSAPFIFVNSAAGLAGNADSLGHLPGGWIWLAVAAAAGGWVGARWGSRFAQPARLRPALALVLAIAVVKLVVT
ncbi:MAG: sulfite exporter TauE/SafE family protein [Verrucomicrobia bacterium]|nr:sulfite exporter TauE/SafE family protein [Verrucomicrobiota bacterium]